MYRVEELSPTKKRLRIEIPREVVEKEISDAYSRLNKRVKVPGFRPGRVPRDILERKYSKNIEAEVIERLVPDYYIKSVKESGIFPTENPTFEGDISIKKDSSITFEASVEVKPHVEVRGYGGIEIKRLSSDVSEDEVERALKNLQESHARLEPFEEDHQINNGDFCLIAFEGSVGDKPIEGGNVKDCLLEVGSNVLVPGFEERLIGSRKGDKIDLKVTFPQDYRDNNLAGKDALFKVEIKEVKKKVLPELDDEFAKDLGQNSMQDVRTLLRERLEKDKKRLIENDYKEGIIKKLVQAHSFEIPPSMLERELTALINRRKGLILQGGGSLEGFDEDKLRVEFIPLATERVKAWLILEAIGKKEGISVSDEDIDKRIEEIASGLNRKPEEIKRLYISKDGSLERLRDEIFGDKILDYLLSKVVFK